MTHRNLVILTGAGVSAESGLGTFRDKDGIWTRYPLEDLATPEGFARNPAFVHGFYNDRRLALKTARPNAAHRALARLEAEWGRRGGRFTLVTQNVDNLHEQAGSDPANLIHMHGDLLTVRCSACGTVAAEAGAISQETGCLACGASAMRPNVVWFGEMPFGMDRIEAELAAADLFVSIGTSGNVYPAAGFCELARMAGARTVELNLEPSDSGHRFDEHFHGPASEVVPRWVAGVLAGL